jgi:hypothetical protein
LIGAGETVGVEFQNDRQAVRMTFAKSSHSSCFPRGPVGESTDYDSRASSNISR